MARTGIPPSAVLINLGVAVDVLRRYAQYATRKVGLAVLRPGAPAVAKRVLTITEKYAVNGILSVSCILPK